MMISDSEYLEFLKDKSLDSSLEANLKKIIDEELEKSEEEMDPDLIEFCLDALEKAKSVPEQPIKKTKRKKFSKMLLIASVVVIFITIAIPVSAAFIHNGVMMKRILNILITIQNMLFLINQL